MFGVVYTDVVNISPSLKIYGHSSQILSASKVIEGEKVQSNKYVTPLTLIEGSKAYYQLINNIPNMKYSLLGPSLIYISEWPPNLIMQTTKAGE